MACRKRVASNVALDAGGDQGFANCPFQWLIQPTNQHALPFEAAAVNSNDTPASGESLQAPWFIKQMTRQVKRAVVVGLANAFEQVQVKFVAGQLTSNL